MSELISGVALCLKNILMVCSTCAGWIIHWHHYSFPGRDIVSVHVGVTK